MAYLAYPKHLYLDGDLTKASVRVEDEQAEAGFVAQGYAALPASVPVPGSIDALKAEARYLEYPKVLTIDGAEVRVESEQDAVRLGLIASADEAPAAEKPKRGRPAKS